MNIEVVARPSEEDIVEGTTDEVIEFLDRVEKVPFAPDGNRPVTRGDRVGHYYPRCGGVIVGAVSIDVGSPVERIVSRVLVENIAPCAAVNEIVPVTTVEFIVSIAPVKRIVPLVAVEFVIVGTPVEVIVPVLAVHLVETSVGEDIIVARAAVDIEIAGGSAE